MSIADNAFNQTLKREQAARRKRDQPKLQPPPLKWYAFTGVVDGDHYHSIFQAESLAIATRLFGEDVYKQLAAEFDQTIEQVEEDHCGPWVVSCTRSSTEPERLYIS